MAASEKLPPPQGLPYVLDPGRVHADEDRTVRVNQAFEGQLFTVDAAFAQARQTLVGIDLYERVVAVGPLLVVDEEGLDVGDLHPRSASWLSYQPRGARGADRASVSRWLGAHHRTPLARTRPTPSSW